MIPKNYNIKNNMNYWVIRSLWNDRDEDGNRIKIREAIKWIRLDIAEFIRYGN